MGDSPLFYVAVVCQLVHDSCPHGQLATWGGSDISSPMFARLPFAVSSSAEMRVRGRGEIQTTTQSRQGVRLAPTN